MKGVTFGTYHSYDDFNLILNAKNISSPSPKVETVDIPGGDGVLDLTEAFGEVKFNNRLLTFNFTTLKRNSEFLELFSEVQNSLQGKKLNIVLDDDPDYYYVGRITVSEWLANKGYGTIVIECDCEPYKYKLNKTIVTTIVSNNATITCYNLRKSVSPTITLTAAAQVTFKGTTYSMDAGTYNAVEILFTEGANVLTVTGNTTITFEYREGGL